MSGETFDVVFVCTANRFRSALSEGLLHARLENEPFSVRSCGTMQAEGNPAEPEAIKLGAGFGIDLSEHRSRSITSSHLETADLVIGFELVHVAQAVIEGGANRSRSFTLLELLHALSLVAIPQGTDPVRRAREIIPRANALRPGTPGQIYDPVGGPRRGYTKVAEQLRDLIDELADYLLPVTSRAE